MVLLLACKLLYILSRSVWSSFLELLILQGDICLGNEHHLVADHRAAVLLFSLLIMHALCPAGCAQLRGPAQAPLNWPSCNIIEAIIRLCYEIA